MLKTKPNVEYMKGVDAPDDELDKISDGDFSISRDRHMVSYGKEGVNRADTFSPGYFNVMQRLLFRLVVVGTWKLYRHVENGEDCRFFMCPLADGKRGAKAKGRIYLRKSDAEKVIRYCRKQSGFARYSSNIYDFYV